MSRFCEFFSFLGGVVMLRENREVGMETQICKGML